MTEPISIANREKVSGPIEETDIFAPLFNADGLIPTIVTEHDSGLLLMMAWMNEAALQKTMTTGDVYYWSRSRRTLWRKGETSGHTQRLVELRTDCDQDALHLVVEQKGPACHTNRKSCFYRVLTDQNGIARLTIADN